MQDVTTCCPAIVRRSPVHSRQFPAWIWSDRGALHSGLATSHILLHEPLSCVFILSVPWGKLVLTIDCTSQDLWQMLTRRGYVNSSFDHTLVLSLQYVFELEYDVITQCSCYVDCRFSSFNSWTAPLITSYSVFRFKTTNCARGDPGACSAQFAMACSVGRWWGSSGSQHHWMFAEAAFWAICSPSRTAFWEGGADLNWRTPCGVIHQFLAGCGHYSTHFGSWKNASSRPHLSSFSIWSRRR